MTRVHWLWGAIPPLTIIIGLTGCAIQPTTINENRLHQAGLINAQLGIDYMQQRHLNRAYQKLKLARSQYPNSPKILNAYALLMQRLRETGKARSAFQKALELNPGEPEVHNNYGAFLCSQKEYSAAQKQFRLALSNPLYRTPQYAYANAGLCYLNMGQLPKAILKFQQALKVAPLFPPALFNLTEITAKNKNWTRADHYLGMIPRSTLNSSPTMLGLCMRIKRHLNNLNAAANCARILYLKYPNSPEAKALLRGQGS